MCKKYKIFSSQQTTSPKQQISQSTVRLFQTGFTALFWQWFKENQMQSFIKLVNSALIQKQIFLLPSLAGRKSTCSAISFLTCGTICCARRSRTWNWKCFSMTKQTHLLQPTISPDMLLYKNTGLHLLKNNLFFVSCNRSYKTLFTALW